VAGIHGATASGGVAVYVNSNGQLGTLNSSARFKEEIRSMDKASEAVLSLKPVTFRYKEELDPDGIPQFGLVAEEVEKVNPALVTRDAEGKVYTVRYEAVNAMLLNEFLKEHRKVEEQARKVEEQEAIITQVKSTMAKQETTIAQQAKGIEVLTAAVKEQALQIQKVNDRLESNKHAPQTVVEN
jgi:type I site-specific restriction endonuclease